jgi:hypothetical protein
VGHPTRASAKIGKRGQATQMKGLIKIDDAHEQWVPMGFSDEGDEGRIKAKIHCPICDVTIAATFFQLLDDYRRPKGGYELVMYHRNSKEDRYVKVEIEYFFRGKENERFEMEHYKREEKNRLQQNQSK